MTDNRHRTGHRRLPAKLVTLTVGIVATGICLVIAAILVRVFANGQSGNTKWILISGGAAVGTFAAGLFSEPVVTRVLRWLDSPSPTTPDYREEWKP